MRLLGTDGVDGSADLLDVEGLGTLLADMADFLPGVVLVLALLRDIELASATRVESFRFVHITWMNLAPDERDV
jgi:hypothetical protein